MTNALEMLGKIKPRNLFLIDSMGALISAALLGLVLANLEGFFGMPRKVLYPLAFIACGFALYSMLCFLTQPKNWRLYLKIIAIVNLLYCCLTLGLVIERRAELSLWGCLYFVGEVAVVLTLAIVELKMSKK